MPDQRTLRAVSLLALIAAAAWPPQARALEAAATQVRIVFYQRGYAAGSTEPPTVATDRALDLFRADNPDIRVDVVGIPYTPEGDARLHAAVASRAGVDLARLTSAEIPRYARQGLLSEITPWLTPADRQDFLPNALEAASYGGKPYAWPLWVTAMTILANTDLLKERGVEAPSFDAPWSFDRFAEACRKLSFKRQDGTRVYALTAGAAVPALIYIDGGRILSPDGRTFWGNRPEAVSALAKLARLQKRCDCLAPDFLSADESATREHFKTGAAAMLLSPPGYIRTLAAERFRFQVLPLPLGRTGKPATTGGFGLYGVIASGDQDRVAAAQRLAKWLTGSEVGSRVPGYQLAPGLRRSNQNLAADELFAPIAKAVGYGVYEAPTEVPDEIGRVGLVNAMRSAIFGKSSARGALDGFAPIYQRALDQAAARP
ncbi:MAG: extracellular solute-binding protein [Elusimicrobia bacterium]|nr:extracellular solute-binding protein [Elusimicrobiota bacterium]